MRWDRSHMNVWRNFSRLFERKPHPLVGKIRAGTYRVLSSISCFEPKNSIQYLWIWSNLVTNVLYDGQCRASQSHFIGCFTEVKSCEVCAILLDKGLFLKNRMTLSKTMLLQVHECVKNCQSGRLLVTFCCLAGQILVYKIWLPTTYSFYKVTYSFWLYVAWCGFLLICAPSFVAVV